MLMCWRAAFHDFLVAMISKFKLTNARNHTGFRQYASSKLGRQAPELCSNTVSR